MTHPPIVLARPRGLSTPFGVTPAPGGVPEVTLMSEWSHPKGAMEMTVQVAPVHEARGMYGRRDALTGFEHAAGDPDPVRDLQSVRRQTGPLAEQPHQAELADSGGGSSRLMLRSGLGPRAIGGTPVVLALEVGDADAVFAEAVTAGAEVRQPLHDAFWGDRHGQLEDPFGHRWNVTQHLRDVPRDEIVAAAAAAFACPCATAGCSERRSCRSVLGA